MAARAPGNSEALGSGTMFSLTGHWCDDLLYAHWGVYAPSPTLRVAIVGGGPAGVAAAIGLIQSFQVGQANCLGLPRLAITIFEKRREASRRQHVYLDFSRLPGPVGQALRLNQPRIEALLEAHGASTAPGASLELRVLEMCLRQMLVEVAQATRGHIAVRWCAGEFMEKDSANFDHVVGADGRRSNVRQILMADVPLVRLAQKALEVEFAYNCHLEWMGQDKVHILKAHKYEAWQPLLLYHRLSRREGPEYVPIHQVEADAVRKRFRVLCDDGAPSPFVNAFSSAEEFLSLFVDQPDLQSSLRASLETDVAAFDAANPAIIAPVEQTLHRAPCLVSQKHTKTCAGAREVTSPRFWLLGDAAVGLPVSKGCNLVYHMASAGRLATALLEDDAAGYERFVFESWHDEAWREGRGPARSIPPGCFAVRRSGRFTC